MAKEPLSTNAESDSWRFLLSNSEWLLLSHPWGPTCPAYADGDRIRISEASRMACGDSCNSLQFAASNHIGTHIDMPRHFSELGARVGEVSPSYFVHEHVGVVWLDAERNELLTWQRLQSSFLSDWSSDATLLLIRTGAGTYRQHRDFWECGPGIASGVAAELRRHLPQLRSIGLDSISLTAFQHRDTGRAVHREFLHDVSPITIVEDMQLEVLSRRCPQQVLIAPLMIEKADGAPVTVFARIS